MNKLVILFMLLLKGTGGFKNSHLKSRTSTILRVGNYEYNNDLNLLHKYRGYF